MEVKLKRFYSEFLLILAQETLMAKNSSRLTDLSMPTSVRNAPVHGERPGPGKLPSRWPFTVEKGNSAMRLPAVDSLPLARMESSHFIT